MNMDRDYEIQGFWQSYLNTLPEGVTKPTSYETWCFGNNAHLAEQLGELARAGIKTATCSLVWENELTGQKIPLVGQINLVMDWDGHPICILETTWISVLPFDGVDEHFAYEEGEGDRSLNHWRESHWRYFSKVCDSIKRLPVPSMPLLCERFRLLYP